MGVGFLIPRLVKKLKIKHVHTVHDVQLVEPSGIILKNQEKSWRYNNIFSSLYARVMRFLLGSPNIVISPSKFLLEFLTERGFFPKSTMVMLRNPAPEPVSLALKKEEIGLPLNLLYLGQVEEHKGTLFLWQALRDYFQAGKMVWHIVGGGSLLPAVKEQVEGYSSVKVYGKVEHAKLSEIFKDIDLAVVPSLCYENSPTVIFESFSFGVPVLASRVEGVEELIQEGENGLTFETGNFASLRQKIEWCFENKSKLRIIGQNGQKMLSGLSEKDYIEKLINLY
jgi:glycosyltransferase involved in cell wall biosynthesis